jgi:electron transfer flavoprotein alpha subunit
MQPIQSYTTEAMAEKNNLIVYCEYDEGRIADVSLELLTKGRVLADRLGVKLEAVVLGDKLEGIEKQIFPYGADTVYKIEDKRLFPYTSNPHAGALIKLFREIEPQICLMGATCIGRDLGPRVSSCLHSGLTADCTALEIGDHKDAKTGKEYKDLLYQIRPAFGGNIVATIVNPECRPQMATVREGVMKKEVYNADHKGQVVDLKASDYVEDADFVVEIIDRHIEKSKVNIKNSPIIVAGGYGVGSKENFQLLFDLADTLGAEVGASRAAVDAGYIEHERQIGQTGVTVRPKLYIACGISGQIQHIAGMQESSIIISINNDPNAPINAIADYVITGNMEDVVPKLIKYYKKNSK